MYYINIIFVITVFAVHFKFLKHCHTQRLILHHRLVMSNFCSLVVGLIKPKYLPTQDRCSNFSKLCCTGNTRQATRLSSFTACKISGACDDIIFAKRYTPCTLSNLLCLHVLSILTSLYTLHVAVINVLYYCWPS